MKRAIVLALAALVVVGCWMDHSPLLNPATGKGTDYPCVGHPTWNYCGDHTCCPEDYRCEVNPKRCDGANDDWNTEWMSAKRKRSLPRQPANAPSDGGAP